MISKIIICFNEEQVQKWFSPIEVTEEGIAILVRQIHDLKADLSIERQKNE